ncbi:MAG: ATP-binding protein [Defluviitaleaceae bacterium]|nr:ATP-binding protein [Defluviitaleaceae bacterium]
MSSVQEDPAFGPHDEVMHISSISYALSHVDMQYALVRQNFFAENNNYDNYGLDITYIPDRIEHHSIQVEASLQHLRDMANSDKNESMARIDSRLESIRQISMTLMIITFAMLLAVAFFTIKSFRGSLGRYSDKVLQISKGNLDAGADGSGGDEVSRMISNVADIFTSLIREINSVSAQSSQGNVDARVDSARFEGVYRDTAFAINSLLDTIMAEKETNRRMRIMFESTPLVIEYWDKNHNLIDSNQKASIIFETQSKESYQKTWLDYSPEYQPSGVTTKEFMADFLQRASRDGYARSEYFSRKANGEILTFDMEGIAVHSGDETVIVTYSSDITELRKIQKSNLEALERMRLMINGTPQIIEYWNRDLKCIDSNRAAVDFYGEPSDEGYSETFLPHTQPNGSPTMEFWQDKLRETFLNLRADWEFACENIHGELTYLEVRAWCMNYNNEITVVTYSNDVTELRKSLARSKEAEERSQIMLDGVPLPCYLITESFEVINCNREVLKFFEFDSIEEGMQSFKEVFLRYYENEMRAHFDFALQSGYERFEWSLENQSGVLIPCEITFVRLSLGGENVIAAYIFDLSMLNEMMQEKNRTEAAEENSEAKSRFLARMSHEIRTPISAVLGIAEIQLQKTGHSLDIEEAFAKIHNSANILLGIVNDILDLSKIEAGKLSLINDKYEVASLVSDVVQLNLTYLGSKKIDFNIEVDESIPSHLVGDELRLKQILNNLLSNSFKYTEAGSVTLTIYAVASSEDRYANLVISIADTGRGMSPEQLESLFDEYTRFHESEARYVKGTGLGMSIANQLLAMMGGTIDVDSEEGKGTSVTLNIPQIIASDEALGAVTSAALANFNSHARAAPKKLSFVPEPMPYGRVLVVDDVETNLYVAKGLMSLYKLQIETCDSGFAAIEKVKKGNVYDIIFMDQMMPEMSGTETTQLLRGMGYSRPIVALTANALVGQAEEFMKNRFDGFISKPIQTAHLNGILNKFIKDKRSSEAEREEDVADIVIDPDDDAGFDDYLLDPELVAVIRADFIKTQSNAMEEINRAIANGDIKTAHRLAHSLKGMAGLLNEQPLAKAAQEAEHIMKRGAVPEDSCMQAMETELNEVLRKIGGI